ncbi:MAG: ankyrin repeat domain-containing protein, partial [Rectinema sp.]|nr:ankyrin repeat domain-containing protein [Rectinema sp.]
MNRKARSILLAFTQLSGICVLILSIAIFAGCASSPSTTSTPPSLNELVRKGDKKSLNELLSRLEEYKQQANIPDKDGLFPLHVAVSNNDLETARILLLIGAKPDNQDLAGKTALRYAIDGSMFDMITLLAKNGANPFVADKSGRSPAHVVLESGRSLELLKALCNESNIATTSDIGRTMYHYAAEALNVEAAKYLLTLATPSGASNALNLKDRSNRTALDLVFGKIREKPSADQLEAPLGKDPSTIAAATIAEMMVQKGGETSLPEFSWFVRLVQQGNYAAARFENGNTALHEAVRNDQYGCIEFLLQKDVGPNERNSNGESPLHMAAARASYESARLLLKAGPDRISASLADRNGNTPLHVAVARDNSEKVIELLFSHGVQADPVNFAGDTPLMTCLKNDRYARYGELLVRKGASVLITNRAGESPLSIAIAKGKEAVGSIILNVNANTTDADGNSVLMTAVSLRAPAEVLRLILTRGARVNASNKIGDTALHLAVRGNYEEQGVVLIEADADVFLMNQKEENPLFLALTSQPAPIDWFFRPKVIQARDADGNRVVHHAASKNLPNGIAFLLTKGADLNVTNNHGETPLHSAARNDAVDAIRYLLANNASRLAIDNNGNIPLQSAVLASKFLAAKEFVTSAASVLELDSQNLKGETALYQAARGNDERLIALLTQAGAHTEIQDEDGLTPLAIAAKRGNVEAITELAKAKASIETRTAEGSTPLLLATQAEFPKAVRILLDMGANPHGQNRSGSTPFLISLQKPREVWREY